MIRFFRTLLRSLRLYLTIMFPYRRVHFRLFRRPKIEITEYELRVSDRILKPDVYRRRDGDTASRRPAIVIFVPLAREGKRDKLVTNFMEGMARLGYVVMVPFWPERAIGTIALTDADDLAASIRWFKHQPDVDPERIGVVAVSYGVGPALAVANDPKRAADIQFIAAIGGYADLKNAIRFALTGAFDYREIQGKLKPDPYLTHLVRTGAGGPKKNPALTKLLRAKTSTAFNEAFADLPAPMKTWFNQLSPIGVAANVKTPLLILHSTNDTLVPYTESLRLYDAVRSNPHASLTLVDIFEHTVPVAATPANLIRIYLPNLWRIVRYIYRILSYQEK